MPVRARNLFAALPVAPGEEVFELLSQGDDVRIERIISQGHTSPVSGWYDQPQHEWVMVVQGEATLQFADAEDVQLGTGDYIDIPSHTRHRVKWTHPELQTIWLAVHYGAPAATNQPAASTPVSDTPSGTKDR